ncbi:MAG: TolC family protein [Desulfovibrionaceae bacterium]|jgi:outer membrane protein TolC|nr:TolC family protein [Desulfovibrionaceae bacterium]
MNRLHVRRLAALVLMAACCAQAAAAEVAGGFAASSAFGYPAELPPQALVRQALERLPELEAARAGIRWSAAERQRLESGPHEWSLRGETAQRRTRGEGHFRDHEITIERPLRWFGKAGKDGQIGQQTVALAEAAHADVWHEAGRALLAAWFAWLREERAAGRIAAQAALSQQWLDGMAKRVRAGESPKMQWLLAQTEHERLLAVLQQAAQRAELARIALEQKYPGLPLPAHPADAPLPEVPAAGAQQGDWVARITAGNHEVEQAAAQTRQKQLQAERSALDRKPDPTLALRYTTERSGADRMIGVAVSIPLPGQARSAAYAGALAQLDQASQQEQQVRGKVERQARQLAAQAQAAAINAAAQARISQLAQSNAALVAKAYALGESAFADTLLANRQALEAAQVFEAAHIDALELHARILLDAHLIWAFERE